MTGQPHMQPYGNSWANNTPAPTGGSMEEQALQRARQKLELVRSGRSGDVQAGFDLVVQLPWILIGCLLGLPMWLLAFTALTDKEGGSDGVSVVLFLFGALFLLIPVAMHMQTRLGKPKGTLLSFYRALSRGRYERARKLIVRPDLDQFPRFQPRIADLGMPTNYPRGFNDERMFSDYWRELLLSTGSWSYCLAAVKNVRETPIAPDVMLVDFELRLMMNTRVYLLLFFVIGILAALIDMATRKTVTLTMRKVLIRVGDEWHLFSGEWQGYDEFNLDWIRDGGAGMTAPRTESTTSRAPWE